MLERPTGQETDFPTIDDDEVDDATVIAGYDEWKAAYQLDVG